MILFVDTFQIWGVSENDKEYFFMKSEISRTLRARKLIEKYAEKRIEGFPVEEIKSWFKKDTRKRKKKR